jgi:AraC family transcriptional regulator
LLVAIVVYVSYVMTYVGAFKNVEISEVTAGPFHMLFKEHSGADHKIVPVIEEVETWAKANGLSCQFSFGEYFDNPQETDEGRLRSIGGCVVNEGETLPQQLPEGFQTKDVPANDYVKATFEGSPGIGAIKVYPKVISYFVEKGYIYNAGVLEVYEVHSEQSITTNYYFPKGKN